MSSLRKHRKNKVFYIVSLDTNSPSTRVVACTAPEALKGFLAFRATPSVPPVAVPVPRATLESAQEIVAKNWRGRVIVSGCVDNA